MLHRLWKLETIIERHLKKRAVGGASRPAENQTRKEAGARAKKGVPNPFKPGETMDVAAKPASVRVRITPLKKLKDMASKSSLGRAAGAAFSSRTPPPFRAFAPA